jgi:hypothetical protein
VPDAKPKGLQFKVMRQNAGDSEVIRKP